MILINELKGEFAKNGFSQAKVAKGIGITPRTFYNKMKKGVFGSDEIDAIVELVHIENPARIFFAKKVT